METKIINRITASLRKKSSQYYYGGLPDFAILGAQKAGTTALYDYLSLHPGILPSRVKEVHFFDRYESREKGLSWYTSYFPNERRKEIERGRLGYSPLSGEATGAYLFHPQVPRLFRDLSEKTTFSPKLIVLLRDPVWRALSHYQHNRRRKNREDLSFHDAVLAEDDRISADIERLHKDYNFQPASLMTYSYASRGLYMEQIERWLNYFPKHSFLFLSSSELKQNPKVTVESVFSFLGLPSFDIGMVEGKHVAEYKREIDSKTMTYLYRKVSQDSARLFEFLGRDLWCLK